MWLPMHMDTSRNQTYDVAARAMVLLKLLFLVRNGGVVTYWSTAKTRVSEPEQAGGPNESYGHWHSPPGEHSVLYHTPYYLKIVRVRKFLNCVLW